MALLLKEPLALVQGNPHGSEIRSRLKRDSDLICLTATSGADSARTSNMLCNNVRKAIEELGSGFLADTENEELQNAIGRDKLDSQEYYRQLLFLVYRMIFLLIAEEREALLDPDAHEAAKSRYIDAYSTRRLLSLGGKSACEPNRNVWRRLRTVMLRLNSGCSELALPMHGSFMWSPKACPALMVSECSNECVLNSLRHLACIPTALSSHQVNSYEPADLLGRIYERLLELRPQFGHRPRTFSLSNVDRHERKATGSYYTPTSLVEGLLDWALDPVLDEAVEKPDPQHAILSLKVCDPACGSGNFLIAAARRIAKRLAIVRTHNEQPHPSDIQRALGHVVSRCIYGVDLNDLSVEICKIGLWLEAIEPGRPLSFLDSHIKCGNALLGTTPELMARGILGKAFNPIDGDYKPLARQLNKQNRKERDANEFGQKTMFAEFESEVASYQPSGTDETEANATIRNTPIRSARGRQVSRSGEDTDRWFRADAWCAAFVWPMRNRRVAAAAITQERWLRMSNDSTTLSALTRKTVRDLARRYRFFHWHLAFEHVFGPPIPCPSNSNDPPVQCGFDVTIGNPPFVNSIEGGISSETKALLRAVSPHLGGTADLAFHFVPLAHRITHRNGRIGMVQPKTFLNADSAADVRSRIGLQRPPARIYVPDTARFFDGVSAYVCLLVLVRGGRLYVSDSDSPVTANWHDGVLRDNNWWRSTQIILGHAPEIESANASPMGSVFSIAASMTTGDAYTIRPHILEDANSKALKLVTTGLIDPFVCRWGEAPCRYLGNVYRNPCVTPMPFFPPALNRRLHNARRPKVLIAGLAKRLEAYVDVTGCCCGAVSTFSIFHPEDSIDALVTLCRWLNGRDATMLIRSELGAASVNGNYMTIKKNALTKLRVPDSIIVRSNCNGT